MTSNLGSDVIRDRMAAVEGDVPAELGRRVESEVMELLKRQLRPEFLNRVDEIVMFNPLRKSDIRAIVEIQFDQIRRLVERTNDVTIDLTDRAKDWLGEKGFDPIFGARPLKRLMQRELTNKLAEEILSGWIGDGAVVVIDLAEDGTGLVFEMSAESELVDARS
jgi:ATP-dependent Clp protease ATP-binding subunit ClpB